MTSRTTAHQNQKSVAGRCFFSDSRLITVPDFCAPTISGFDEVTVLLRLSHNIHANVLNFVTYRIKKSAARRDVALQRCGLILVKRTVPSADDERLPGNDRDLKFLFSAFAKKRHNFSCFTTPATPRHPWFSDNQRRRQSCSAQRQLDQNSFSYLDVFATAHLA